MSKKYLMQNGITKMYYFDLYKNKDWSNDILDAKLFDSEYDVEQYLKENIGKFFGCFIIINEVFINR